VGFLALALLAAVAFVTAATLREKPQPIRRAVPGGECVQVGDEEHCIFEL
jgi:hypothetical protein